MSETPHPSGSPDDNLGFRPHGVDSASEPLPYHELLCDVLSSELGVRCCARLIVTALLYNHLGSAALDHFLDDLGL